MNKIRLKNKIDKYEYIKENCMNNRESKRATKSNSNNDANVNK